MPAWVDIAGGSAASATTVALIGTGIARLGGNWVKRIVTDAVEALIAPNTADTQAVKAELAKQFGGNSGGMRQAINELSADVAYLKGVAGVAQNAAPTSGGTPTQ